MPTFNLKDQPPLCSFRDLKPPPKKAPPVPTHIRLRHLLTENLGAVMSTGGQTFAYVPTRFNSFNVPLHSDFIRAWLTEYFTKDGDPPPTNQQLRHAIQSFESRPIAGSIAGFTTRMNIRTAWAPRYVEPVPETDTYGNLTGYDQPGSPSKPAIVFSLDTHRGHHVAVTAEGWSLQPTALEFVYHPTQRALPDPETPDSESDVPDSDVPDSDPEAPLLALKKLLRLDAPRQESAWKALLDWILAAMRPAKNEAFHDYPILNLVGPAASGKSVAAKLLVHLLDPSGVCLHSLPATERRLHVLAAAQHILAFDNPGKINPEKSRYLSRLSTGIASLYRQFQGMLVRPIILTTRNHQETRHLTTRVVDVELPPLDHPLSQQEIWDQFEKLRPALLAALFTRLSQTFNSPPTHLPNRVTKWQKLEESIPSFIARQGGSWQGTATDLGKTLDFPITLKALGQYLNRTASLRVTRKKNNATVTLEIHRTFES